jgi:GT2 family glycosyltransferase
VIAFGSAITSPETYERFALPGIRRVQEPDSPLLSRSGYDSIQRPYNEILDEAAALDDLEALVLVHQDLELTDRGFLANMRRLLAQPGVGVVGMAGARAISGLGWWEGEVYGGCFAPGFSGRFSIGSHEVEMVDGALLVLAPWVVRTIRFDETFSSDFHGYDVDFCLQARAAGGRVIVTDIGYHHDWTKDPGDDRERWTAASIRLSRKWEPELWPAAWGAP